MSRFNHYFANDFAACRLLAHARDMHRERDVRIYLIPGEMECVGVTDGTDKWIAPTIISPFSVDVGDIIRKIYAGEAPKLPVYAPGHPGGPDAPKGRRRLVDSDSPPNPPPSGRRRLLSDPDATQAPTRRRALID